jgi:hypothetical protein
MDTRRVQRSLQKFLSNQEQHYNNNNNSNTLNSNNSNNNLNTEQSNISESKMESNILLETLQSLKPTIGELPKFNGSNSGLMPEEFLSKFNRHALVNGWSEEKKMLIVPLQLKDSADTWFESLPDDSPIRENWDDFRTALIDRFHDSNKDVANFQLFSSRKQRSNETVEKYIEEMKKLAKSVRDKELITEKVQVMTILNNLLPKLKYNIQMSGEIPSSVSSLEARVKIAEAAINELQSSYDRNGSRKRNYQRDNNQKSNEVHESGSYTKVLRDVSQITCYNCNDKGHYKSDCPKLTSSKRDVTCYTCRQKGHISPNCPNKVVSVKEEKKESNIRVININDKNVEDGDFKCVAHIADVRVTVTFDTGSHINCISEVFYNRMDVTQYPIISTTRQFTHAVGGGMDCVGKVTLPVEFHVETGDSKVQMLEFYVIKGLSDPVLIGRGEIKTVQLSDGTILKRSENVVRLKKAVTVPPFSVKLIKLVSDNVVGTTEGVPVLMEPVAQKNCVVARCITRSCDMVTNVMNMNANAIHIAANEIVGTVTEVEPHDSVEVTESTIDSSAQNTSTEELIRSIGEDTFRSDIIKQIDEGLSLNDQKRVIELLTEFRSVFASNPKAPMFTSTVEHAIETLDAKPIKLRSYRTSQVEQEMIDKEVDEMLANGIIRKSNSPWSFPVVMVDKPDGSKRFCIDYRMLNNVTVKDSYPLPRIHEAIDILHGAKYFSTIDFNAGYWQIPMKQSDIPKTAFVTRKGLYEWLRMAFGLANAPATFQRTMDVLLSGLTWRSCLVYIDDILVFSCNLDEHLKDLREVLLRLKESNFSIKLSKCRFAKKEAEYLGHVINEAGVMPHPSKTQAVKEFKTPSNLTDVRSFMGIVNYYHRFIQNLGMVAEPLYRLMKKNVPFQWTTECENAFQTIKTMLISSPILRFPDFTKEFILQCDASDVGIGTVLSQIDDEGMEYAVSFGSRSLSKEERNYSVSEKECLAVLFGIKSFRPYLYGKHFKVYTDHSSLSWLLHLKDPNGRLARWALQLQANDFTIYHRAGKDNGNADTLSRNPLLVRMVTTRRTMKKNKSNSSSNVIQVPDVVVNDSRGGIQDEVKMNSNQDLKTDVENIIIPLPDAVELQSRFRDTQMQDPHLCPMIEYLKSKKLPEDMNSANKIKIDSSSFMLENNLLFHIWIPTNTNKNMNVRKQLVVPSILRQTIMSECHDSYSGGHFGTDKTFNKIRDRFWWVTMFKDVDAYCKSCIICQNRRIPRREQSTALMSTPIADGPFERWGVDIVGPLPETRNGNKYIVVFTDSFTRWVEAFYTNEIKEEFIAELLVCEIICRYGAPTVLLSDRGSNFLSALSMKVYELLTIKKVNTTAYHPAGNGITERFNGVLVDMLAKFGNEQDWDTFVPYVLSAYRSCYNSTIQESPYYLTFGKQMTLPIDAMLNRGEAYSTSRSDYGDEIAYRLNEAHKRVKELLQNISTNREERNLNLTNPKEFNVGDLVLLRSEVKVGRNRKLNKINWIGPYKVIKRISMVNYKIDIPGPGPKPHPIVHVNRLKKYFNPDSTPAAAAAKSAAAEALLV